MDGVAVKKAIFTDILSTAGPLWQMDHSELIAVINGSSFGAAAELKSFPIWLSHWAIAVPGAASNRVPFVKHLSLVHS